MGFFGGRLTYRLLREYSPGGSRDRLDGSAYASRNKLHVLLGEQLVGQLKGARVLDFGCGDGQLTIDMAIAGAQSVSGLDIQDASFPDAGSALKREVSAIAWISPQERQARSMWSSVSTASSTSPSLSRCWR